MATKIENDEVIPDEELNKILTIIAYLSDKYNFDYKIEDEI